MPQRLRLPAPPPPQHEAPVRREPRSVRAGRGPRTVLVLAFWLALAAGLALWWVDTPAGSVDGVATGLVEVGRITGLIGAYLLLVQTLFMSRVGWLERHVGANELMGLHRDIGAAVVVVVLL